MTRSLWLSNTSTHQEFGTATLRYHQCTLQETYLHELLERVIIIFAADNLNIISNSSVASISYIVYYSLIANNLFDQVHQRICIGGSQTALLATQATDGEDARSQEPNKDQNEVHEIPENY